MKTVSVVIPNYNNAQYLGSAIQSILQQTFTDYEIIVVDDGSTDNSKDVVSAFGDKVRYFWQENKGLGGARNTGILASNAEFIGLLDADDEWKPTYLERMVSLVQRRSDAAVYFCAAQGMDAAGKDLPQIFGRFIPSDSIYQTLLRANFIIPSTVILRRRAVLEAGLFEEKNRNLHGCEDWDLWLRLCPSHQFVGTRERLVRYRLHANTFSANPSHMQGAVKTVIEKNFGLDDGTYENWSGEKRRAFGGMHRYRALTSVQKQGNWEIATEAMRKAINIDPTLAVDLDLFYELGLGQRSLGHRTILQMHEIQKNGFQLAKLINDAFNTPDLVSIRQRSLGTAFYALGLVSYNFGTRSLSRKYFAKALYYRPDLIFNARLLGNFLRAFISKEGVRKIKKLVGRPS